MVTSGKNDTGEDNLPNFSDPEDYVDDISNEDLLPELMAKEPRLEISTEKVIVIDNIPKASADKKRKTQEHSHQADHQLW